jgi:hypothetical protein
MTAGSWIARCSACVALVYLCTAAASAWMKEPYSGVHPARVAQVVGNEPSIVPSPTPVAGPDDAAATDQPGVDTIPPEAATPAPTPADVVVPTIAPTRKTRKTVGPTPAPTG